MSNEKKDINSYEFYSCSECVAPLSTTSIEEAVEEWFQDNSDIKQPPDLIDIYCWEPVTVLYDSLAEKAVESLCDNLYENLDEGYTYEEHAGKFQLSEKVLDEVKSIIIDALKSEFKTSLYEATKTIQVNPSDYIPSHLLEGDINEP